MSDPVQKRSVSTRVLGVDLAAQAKKTWGCTLEARGGELFVQLHSECSDDALIRISEGCAKVAIDAPFGWPDDFVDAVSAHRDGGPWPKAQESGATALRDSLCFRATDRAVMQDRRPLSVAADKLGVTAMRCAGLLQTWQEAGPVDRAGSGRFVEVYPACALVRWDLDPTGYKGPKGHANRAALVPRLENQLPELNLTADDREMILGSDDAFDALVAALAGRAAWMGLTDGPPPGLREAASREGWIHLPLRGSLPSLASSKGALKARAPEALADRLQRGGVKVSSEGYAEDLDDVLMSSVSTRARSKILEDFRGKGGSEFEKRRGGPPKFHAAHSSAALAANSFAPFLDGELGLPIGRRRFKGRGSFERECPTGLRGVPPTLDFLLKDERRVLAVESKCTETHHGQVAVFKPAYAEVANQMHESWRTEFERLLANPHRYRFLNAAQLVKHYLGLKNTFPEDSIVLAYLFWEPSNAAELSVCQIHDAEAGAFAKAVKDPDVTFVRMSYSKLWGSWEKVPALQRHVAALRRRYDVRVAAG